MPSMPRPNNKGKKIAYKIMGKPANMRPLSKRQEEIRRRLLFEQTTRVR